jgi:AhpD family alkylhydroperoxidase
VATVYAQVERDFGLLAPPVALHSPAPDTMAACWIMLRETLLVSSPVGRGVKEAVAAATSLSNDCPYCLDVHVTALHSFMPGNAASAIASNRIDTIEQVQVHAAAAWAQSSGRRDEPIVDLPFLSDQIPELIGVAVTFHYLNRMVTVFLGESPLPSRVPAAMRGRMLSMVGGLLRSAAAAAPQPGASLALLPAAPLPGDLHWAGGNLGIARAFSRAAGAIEVTAEQTVPAAVRERVTAEVAQWDGLPRGISRGWAAEAVSGLAPQDQPAGRLAMLIAMAPYQVAQSDIDEFRRTKSGDGALIGLSSWASFAAARKVGTWLADRTRGM